MSSTPQELTQDTVVDVPVSISVQNVSEVGYAYLGPAGVSSTNFGFKLFPAQTFTADLASYDELFAVGDAGVVIAVLTVDNR